ncbi:MAG: alpha-mannosidase [Opitutales bacterium]|nr:alpha-mannosidase [Opitutales bacterium]
MLPANPFLQLVPQRSARTLRRIEALIWQEVAPLPIEWAGCSPHRRPLSEIPTSAWEPVQTPFFWGKQFDHAWFRLRLPASVRGKGLWLRWAEQGETTVYVNGQPWAGLDVAHRECPLPDEVDEVFLEVVCMESAIWKATPRAALTSEGCRVEKASLLRRNEAAWKAYFDLQAVHEIALREYQQWCPRGAEGDFAFGPGMRAHLDSAPVLYRRLLRALDEATSAFDNGGVEALSASLEPYYAELRAHSSDIAVALTGHAHIDLVWLWPEAAGEFKAVHTFSSMDRLMEMYPEFRFGYSQPASYEAVARQEPGLMERVRARIQSGQWEALGATYVESDTLMACGEALARSFLLGQEGFADLNGDPSRILWLPDVFGYAGCLPQIMRQTGVDRFYTTKLTWGSVTKFPYSSFIWRGTDGSEILAHVSQGFGYNCVVKPHELRIAADEYRQADVHGEVLMPSGYGDGGGGATVDMCERARRFADLAGVPRVKWSRVDEFFDRLDAVRARLPVYQGELYLQYHRGVLTTHGDLKYAFRAAERALQTEEAARVVRGSGPMDNHAWKRVVFSQFHDYIPGSSIQEVYDEGLPELRKIADEAARNTAGLLNADAPPAAAALFNPLPVARSFEHESRHYRMAPLSGAPLADLPRVADAAVRGEGLRIENSRVRAEFTAEGRIAVFAVDEYEIPFAEAGGRLVFYPDLPHQFDAWDIDRPTLALGSPVGLTHTETAVDASGAACIRFSGKVGEKSELSLLYRLRPESPVLDIQIQGEWRETEKLLRMDFPTAFSGRQARFGAPFGSVLRSQQPGEPRDESMWEVPASRWAIVSDDGEREGFALMSEAKYGWSAREGTLGVSLLRAAKVTMSGIHPPIRRETPPSPFSDQGEFCIRLAITRFDAGARREEMPAALAETLFTPALVYAGAAAGTVFEGLEGPSSLLPSWARPEAGGSWVLRMHETMGWRGRARIRLADGWEAMLTDLAGKAEAPLQDGRFSVDPYALISLRIRPSAG